MKANKPYNTILQLAAFLINDDDFKTAYYKHNSEDADIIKGSHSGYKNAIRQFLYSHYQEDTFNYYILDKRYIDLSYIIINDNIINLDDLYIDFKTYAKDESEAKKC